MGDATCLEPECDLPPWSRGWCPYHYNRRRLDGLLKALTPEDRFWNSVEKTDECWVWKGPPQNNGYARLSVNNHRVYVHRFAYELLVGPIPDGLHIDHLCRNRLCVRPGHLEAVTQRVNNIRAVAFRRPPAARSRCRNGHAMTGDNVVIRNRNRCCRQCERDKAREYQRRRRENNRP